MTPPLQALLANILAIAADAIITLDGDQTIQQFNHGAEEIFGYAASEVIGQPLELLIPARFRSTHRGLVAEFGAGRQAARRMGHRREIFGLRKGGIEFPAEASIAKLESGDGRPYYSVVLRDVTDRKRVEAEQRFLASSSAQLATTLNYDTVAAAVAPLPVPTLAHWCVLHLLAPDGRVRTFAAPHAVPDRQAALDRLHAVHPFDEDSPWPASDVLRTGRPQLVERVTDDWLDAHTSSPEHRALLHAVGTATLLIVPLVAHHDVLGVLTLGRAVPHAHVGEFDAADLALAQDFALRAALALENARLYEAARSATRARDVVLGVVSHDLRNPLSAITMCASALSEPPGPPPETRLELAGAIYESAEWMQRLIRDLLDVSAIDAGQLSLTRQAEPVDAILQRLRHLFAADAESRTIALEFDCPPVPALWADAERVVQLLANLIGNALKFTAAGGQVRVSAEHAGDAVRFEVTDTGPGIPAADLPHLFELYWHARRTARRGGSGYGLAISRGIAEAHGGTISVESTEGAGSSFFVLLPAAPQ